MSTSESEFEEVPSDEVEAAKGRRMTCYGPANVQHEPVELEYEHTEGEGVRAECPKCNVVLKG